LYLTIYYYICELTNQPMKHIITFLATFLLTLSTFAQIGINNENPDASAALDITSTTGGLLVPRMTAAQRDAITTPSQGLIIFCTDCASGAGELQIKLTSSWKNTIGGDVNDPPPPAIGDSYQGGIIFYLDGSGGGLIAAPSDQTKAWGCYEQSIGGTSSALGTGAANTTAIVSGCSETAIAAKFCEDYTDGTYSDWFLPSKDELNLMYENIGQGNALGLGNVGNFASDYYWSSTETDIYFAWIQNFTTGNQYANGKLYPNDVRAVRAF
jgi:hypothetical protein